MNKEFTQEEIDQYSERAKVLLDNLKELHFNLKCNLIKKKLGWLRFYNGNLYYNKKRFYNIDVSSCIHIEGIKIQEIFTEIEFTEYKNKILYKKSKSKAHKIAHKIAIKRYKKIEKIINE